MVLYRLVGNLYTFVSVIAFIPLFLLGVAESKALNEEVRTSDFTKIRNMFKDIVSGAIALTDTLLLLKFERRNRIHPIEVVSAVNQARTLTHP